MLLDALCPDFETAAVANLTAQYTWLVNGNERVYPTNL